MSRTRAVLPPTAAMHEAIETPRGALTHATERPRTPSLPAQGRHYLTDLEMYNATTRSWARRASMSVARTHPGLACVRERTLLVMGGYGAIGEAPYDGMGPLTSSEEYDPASDRWYVRSGMPSARYHVTTAAEPEGHVFVAGGYGTELGHLRAAYGAEGILATFECYDPWAAGWVRKAPLPFRAYGIGLTIFDCRPHCKVLAAGGHGVGGVFVRDAAVYNIQSGTWSVAHPLPTPRFGMTLLAAPDDTKAYAVGGYELKLTPPGLRSGSTSDASASAAAVHAAHADSVKRVTEYNLQTDGWWEVPATRQWRTANSFDWRHEQSIRARATAVTGRALRVQCAGRVHPSHNTSATPWDAVNLYVGVDEYRRPEPARCRHGRGLLGCLRGMGVQRDAFGNELPLNSRAQPYRIDYPPDWEAPLRLRPSECADCTLLLGDAAHNPDAPLASIAMASSLSIDSEPLTAPTPPDLYQSRQLLLRGLRNATADEIAAGVVGSRSGAYAAEPSPRQL